MSSFFLCSVFGPYLQFEFTLSWRRNWRRRSKRRRCKRRGDKSEVEDNEGADNEEVVGREAGNKVELRRRDRDE